MTNSRSYRTEEKWKMGNSGFKTSPHKLIHIFEHALIIFAVSADVLVRMCQSLRVCVLTGHFEGDMLAIWKRQ